MQDCKKFRHAMDREAMEQRSDGKKEAPAGKGKPARGKQQRERGQGREDDAVQDKAYLVMYAREQSQKHEKMDTSEITVAVARNLEAIDMVQGPNTAGPAIGEMLRRHGRLRGPGE